PAPGPRDRPRDARTSCDRPTARHGPGRTPGGHRVQDDPIRERSAVRSMAVPHCGFYPACRAWSKAEVEGEGIAFAFAFPCAGTANGRPRAFRGLRSVRFGNARNEKGQSTDWPFSFLLFPTNDSNLGFDNTRLYRQASCWPSFSRGGG